MEGLITPERDDEDTAKLNYVRVQRAGEQANVWYHDAHEEPLVGAELSAAENADEWFLKWYCPRCGTYEDDIPETDLQPAGQTELHRPCATAAELEAAADAGERVVLEFEPE